MNLGVDYLLPELSLKLRDDATLQPLLRRLQQSKGETSDWDWMGCDFNALTRTLRVPGGWEKYAVDPFERFMGLVLPHLDPAQSDFEAVVEGQDLGDGRSLHRWRYDSKMRHLRADVRNAWREHGRRRWVADYEQRIDDDGRWWTCEHDLGGIRTEVSGSPGLSTWREQPRPDVRTYAS